MAITQFGVRGRFARAVLPVVCTAIFTVAALTQRASATWSIILVDTITGEIAVGSATCLTGFDLERWLPVVLVDVGAACAQSFVDNTGQNRRLIFDELLAGTDPEVILELLDAQDAGHQTRQYGIVDALGRAATFTGTQASDWADGVVGQSGSMAYAIQGNILTGEPVVAMALDAVLNTPGDYAEKLMAGMEAARSMGGDGRCSCSPADPTGCGSPPPKFDKSAHVGFMIVTRTSDIDGDCDLENGCATGDYFLNFNIAFQGFADEDPVLQLQAEFDVWRAELIGRPDAVHSTALISPDRLPATGGLTTTMTIEPRDWEGNDIEPGSASVTVMHAPQSDGLSVIGDLVDLGDGRFSVELTAGDVRGIDRFLVVLDDGIRPVTLIPLPTLLIDRPGDADGDGDLDLIDFGGLVACTTGATAVGHDPADPPQGDDPDCRYFDFDVDDDVDSHDFGAFQHQYTGPCAEIVVPPSSQIVCVGDTVVFDVKVSRPDVEFQWLRDGKEIQGATDGSFVIESAGVEDAGEYAVRVTDFCTTTTSAAAELSLFDPPVIVTHPENLGVCFGSPAQMCAEAAGVEPIAYQWLRDGEAIAGATLACLSIESLGPEDLGFYTAVATDACAVSVESNPALLHATDIEIQEQPEGTSVCVGDSVALFIVTSGNPTYQWKKDGLDIPGAVEFFLFIPSVTLKDAGSYTCELTNECGTETSEPAIVEVIDCAASGSIGGRPKRWR